jgi:hypothetical protein
LDNAGDLWMLLIELFGNIKKAEKEISKIRSTENKEILMDFIESGKRLIDKLRKLLKVCETPMLESANRVEGNRLGLSAGIAFVNKIWGRDRELDKTKLFMESVRLWNFRFDANCKELL